MNSETRTRIYVHWRYWRARFRNEARQLLLMRLNERDVVDEAMFGLKRDPFLRKLIEDAESRRDNG
jgi:hypothetical protein